ncbi:MAG: GntR family transcriptional regulator [Actinomycetota bacterium]|nr:GntR family transcriptional regulator [Actinomycetota bacterium]
MNGLDPDDTRPPYQQVAAAVRELISNGQLIPGSKLPKHEQLIAAYGVSLGTVKRALGQLQNEGLIVSRRGEGAFVRSGQPTKPPHLDDPTAEMRREIDELTRRLTIVERKLDQRG